MPPRRIIAIGLIITAVEASSGWSSGRSHLPAAPPPVVTIAASEYAFDAPDSIEAGPTTIRLVSRGREQHFVWLGRIASPHTLAEFKRTLGSPDRIPWITQVGGVGTIEPGGVAMSTIDLAPGLYVMLCDMEDPKGTPHMLEGMVRALTVTHTRNAAAMPVADVALSLIDYWFALPDSLGAGAHVIEVRNAAAQPHMVLLWRLHDGKSAADVVQWMDARVDPGPSPVSLVGGTPDMDPGQMLQLRVRLQPGKYVLICLVDDAHDHKPHYAHGMVREITVGGLPGG
jgi:hypothetical protein